MGFINHLITGRPHLVWAFNGFINSFTKNQHLPEISEKHGDDWGMVQMAFWKIHIMPFKENTHLTLW